MHSGYAEEYYFLLDDLAERERTDQQRRLRILQRGLQCSLNSLRALQGLNVSDMHQEILATWKAYLPELWCAPEAEPLINLLFGKHKN